MFTLMNEALRMAHLTPLPLNALADALGDVRAEIRVLRAREADLRQAVIDARPNGPVSGQRYEVTIHEAERRVFDRDALPKAILADHRFWMTRTSRTVVTRASGPARAPTAPQGPPAGAPQRDLWGEESGLVLIEEF